MSKTPTVLLISPRRVSLRGILEGIQALCASDEGGCTIQLSDQSFNLKIRAWQNGRHAERISIDPAGFLRGLRPVFQIPMDATGRAFVERERESGDDPLAEDLVRIDALSLSAFQRGSYSGVMIWYTTRSAGQFLFESPSMRRGLLDVLNRNQGVVAVVDLEDNDWTFLDNVSLRFTMSEEEVEATSDPEGELDFDRFVPWVLRKRVNLDESNDG